ncbi:MAG TPA: hypothetical protein VGP63_15420 [Planctomycetaceae bacterium]|jgi:hypothetical protein|nr:hypothetical protein [Planctomycetaceae bacterium]
MNGFPANRTQMWLARGGMAACGVLVVVLQVFGLGSISSVRDGQQTIYSASLLGPVLFGVFGLVICTVAIVFWMQPGRFFRLVSLVLFLLAISAFIEAPDALAHRLCVTPDGFVDRSGAWYRVEEIRVDFGSLSTVTVGPREGNEPGDQTQELRCFPKDGGETVRISIYDMMKEALPEILRNAARHGVFVVRNVERPQLPSADEQKQEE